MAASGPLAGVRVVDMSRLAPGPYCTMLLADLGAEVIEVGGGRSSGAIPEFSRGKTHISLNLKAPEGQKALRKLVETADVFVEGFRPGVAAKLGAGYDALSALNPGLVYCSITGYGQDGPRAQEAGHDINYLAVSGALGAMGAKGQAPLAPLNLIADFAGGSMVAAIGILAAVVEQRTTGKGRYIDAAMIDGSLSLMAMHLPLWNTPHFPERGRGLLAGDMPFYRTYPCADGRYVAVGALEKPFFDALWSMLDLGAPPDHMARDQWPMIESKLGEVFLSRDRDDWGDFFLGSNACVTPVYDPDETTADPQTAHRQPNLPAGSVPVIPRLGHKAQPLPQTDGTDQTQAVLQNLGLSADEIAQAAFAPGEGGETGLHWPPEIR